MEGKQIPDIGLLKTKHSVPDSVNRLLPRLPLNQELDGALKCRLTVVAAPAGIGKTTAALKWLKSIPLPYAWLSIDDYNPVQFWRYLCAALSHILMGIENDTAYVYESQELFHANVHISILIDRLSGIDTDLVFVLDDLHLISNQEIIDALSGSVYKKLGVKNHRIKKILGNH